MSEDNRKVFFSGNICCFGISQVGVPVSVVLAEMCPTLKIDVVDLNPENIMLWNTKQIPIYEPGLEEIMKKCLNRNLEFTTNTVSSIKKADIILMCLNSRLHSSGSYQEEAKNLKDFEKASRIIAEVSETNKIIVLKNTVSIGSSAVIKHILCANRMDNVKFQVLSMPEFFSTGEAVSTLLHPDKILIGSDLTPEAIHASEALAFIYSQWVPRSKIVMMTSPSTELIKLSLNAFLAQRATSLNALSIICEESDADIGEVAKIVGRYTNIDPSYLEPTLGLGDSDWKKDLLTLKRLCKSLNLFEVADYWNQVLVINELQKKRFLNKILLSFFNNLKDKKVGIWGITAKKNMETSKGSVALELCLKLFEEGAKLALYNPKIEKRQLTDELKAAGFMNCPKEVPSCAKEILFCDDPYKAAFKADAIIVNTDFDELKKLDFKLIYKDMIKPAFIFDGRKCLPHEELSKIGFIVETIGKKFQSKVAPHYNK